MGIHGNDPSAPCPGCFSQGNPAPGSLRSPRRTSRAPFLLFRCPTGWEFHVFPGDCPLPGTFPGQIPSRDIPRDPETSEQLRGSGAEVGEPIQGILSLSCPSTLPTGMGGPGITDISQEIWEFQEDALRFHKFPGIRFPSQFGFPGKELAPSLSKGSPKGGIVVGSIWDWEFPRILGNPWEWW